MDLQHRNIVQVIFIARMACKDDRYIVLLSQPYSQRSREHRMMDMNHIKRLIREYFRDLCRNQRRIHHAVRHLIPLRMITHDPFRRVFVCPQHSHLFFLCISVHGSEDRHLMSELYQFLRLPLNGDRNASHKGSVIICQHCYLHGHVPLYFIYDQENDLVLLMRKSRSPRPRRNIPPRRTPDSREKSRTKNLRCIL